MCTGNADVVAVKMCGRKELVTDYSETSRVEIAKAGTNDRHCLADVIAGFDCPPLLLGTDLYVLQPDWTLCFLLPSQSSKYFPRSTTINVSDCMMTHLAVGKKKKMSARGTVDAR